MHALKKVKQSPQPVRFMPEIFHVISDELQPLIELLLSEEERTWLIKNGVLDQQYRLKYQPRSVVSGSATETAEIIKNDFLFEKFMLVMLDGLPGSGKGYLGKAIRDISDYEDGMSSRNFEGDTFLYTQVLFDHPKQLCGLLDMIGVPCRFDNGTPFALDILQKKVFEHRNQIFPTNKQIFQRYYINYHAFRSFVSNVIKKYYQSGDTTISQLTPQYIRGPEGSSLGTAPQTVDMGVTKQKVMRLDGVGTVNSFANFWPEHSVHVVNYMTIFENLINVITRDGRQKERPEFRLKELKHLFFNFLVTLSRADIIHYDQNFKKMIQNDAKDPEHPMYRAWYILKQAVETLLNEAAENTSERVKTALAVKSTMPT